MKSRVCSAARSLAGFQEPARPRGFIHSRHFFVSFLRAEANWSDHRDIRRCRRSLVCSHARGTSQSRGSLLKASCRCDRSAYRVALTTRAFGYSIDCRKTEWEAQVMGRQVESGFAARSRNAEGTRRSVASNFRQPSSQFPDPAVRVQAGKIQCAEGVRESVVLRAFRSRLRLSPLPRRNRPTIQSDSYRTQNSQSPTVVLRDRRFRPLLWAHARHTPLCQFSAPSSVRAPQSPSNGEISRLQ